jgi:ketosteroid isomerase-like protein
MPNANTALIERIFGKVGGGFSPVDAPLYLESMTDDVRYTILGTTPLSGVFRGRDEIVSGIFRPLMAGLDGGIELGPDTLFGEGDMVAMQAHGRARTRKGTRYDNTYCFVFRFRDGRIAEIAEYLDTELVRSALVQPTE